MGVLGYRSLPVVNIVGKSFYIKGITRLLSLVLELIEIKKNLLLAFLFSYKVIIIKADATLVIDLFLFISIFSRSRDRYAVAVN